jgi:hypothetical protein
MCEVASAVQLLLQQAVSTAAQLHSPAAQPGPAPPRWDIDASVPLPSWKKGPTVLPYQVKPLITVKRCVQSGLARPGTLVTLVYHSTVV